MFSNYNVFEDGIQSSLDYPLNEDNEENDIIVERSFIQYGYGQDGADWRDPKDWTEGIDLDAKTESSSSSHNASENGGSVFREGKEDEGLGEAEDKENYSVNTFRVPDPEDFDDDEEFVDDGNYDTWTIFNVLGRGDLDELRLLRMKQGFLKLLESC